MIFYQKKIKKIHDDDFYEFTLISYELKLTMDLPLFDYQEDPIQTFEHKPSFKPK